MFEAEEIFPRKGLGGSSHASTITEGPNGVLYATWYSGSAEKEADVKIYMSMKPREAEGWKEPWLVEKEGITSQNPFLDEAETEEEREMLLHEETSEGNPVVFADLKENRLWLFWETMRGAGEKSGWTMCVLKMKHSDDWGKTWTKPRLLRKDIGWGTRNKPIWLSNGELLLPVSAFGTTFYRWTRDEFSKGSQECKITENGTFIVGRYGQPSVIQVQTGEVVLFMRTTDTSAGCENLIATSRSKDFGHAWSPVEPTRDRIPNPDSGLDAVTLQNGHVVLACNPLKSGRQKLTIFLSEDHGITFPYYRDVELVEKDKNYHYPTIMQSSDALIHLTYTNRRLNIKHACFDEKWIKQSNNE